jgi:hypothetical protein
LTLATRVSDIPSEKSRGVTFALAALLGPFGAHRFYVGKTGTAALMLCTLGGLGLWYLYDLILVAGGSFRDIDGRLVSLWDPGTAGGEARTAELQEELALLRSEVAELADRLDFAERLLANSSPAEDQPRRTLPT